MLFYYRWILYENIDCKGDICVVIKGDDGIKRAVSSLTLLENAVVVSTHEADFINPLVRLQICLFPGKGISNGIATL